jgi:crossover junction endodeoxyribonuclease RuvC
MRVLGIDPGTQVMGYGVVEEERGQLRPVGKGTIAPRGELPERLECIYNGLQEVIRTFSPDAVVMESPFYAKNVLSTLKLGQVQGVVVLAANHASLNSCSYTPMEVKAALVGYGRATKAQVREMVKRLLGIDGALPLDASDALAVAICHIHTAELKERYEQDRSSRRATGR